MQTSFARTSRTWHLTPPIVPFNVLSQRLNIVPEDIIKLDANENPYGPSPRVYQALANETYYHIYPDPDSTALRDALKRVRRC